MNWNRRSKALVRLALLLFLMPSAIALADHDEDDDDRTSPAVVMIVDHEIAIADHESADYDSGDDEGLPPGVVHQDQAAAFAHDANLMATQTGLPVRDVESALAFQDAFTTYGMEELLPRYEDQISAIWVDPAPAARGYVQFVAEIPQQAVAEAARRGLDIVFTGGGEISMAEHSVRSELAADALVAAGYQNFTTHSDRKNKVITIEIRLPEGAPEPELEEIVDLVRKHVSEFGSMLDGRAAVIRPIDVELIVTRGSGPIAVPD